MVLNLNTKKIIYFVVAIITCIVIKIFVLGWAFSDFNNYVKSNIGLGAHGVCASQLSLLKQKTDSVFEGVRMLKCLAAAQPLLITPRCNTRTTR